jgi:hypothetical protein
LYHLSLQAFTNDGTSTKVSAGNLMSRNVAYGYDFVSLIKVCVRDAVPWESEIFHL